MKRVCALFLLATFALVAAAPAAVPTNNPVAEYYDGPEGYPAWTDQIRWDQVINMKTYTKGATNFERFENARDELAARGGGVLYYPAGTYDFTKGPFSGPHGRGLMLPSGVVIRGQAPAGKPKAVDQPLELLTKFVFGFDKRTSNLVETGERFTVRFYDGEVRYHWNRRKKKLTKRNAPLTVTFAVEDGKIADTCKAYRRGRGRDVFEGTAKVRRQGNQVDLNVTLQIPARKNGPAAGPATYKVRFALAEDGTGEAEYTGQFLDTKVAGKAEARRFNVRPETPRDWNLIGLKPPANARLATVDKVGICWVNLVGATIYFGPDVSWGETWEKAGSWKSACAMGEWKNRKPDGTHPMDTFTGGGKTYYGAGKGRLVFGCVLEDATVVNNGVSFGRRDYREGFGEDGFHMYKFGPRIGVYGSRVFVANNRIEKSEGRNFKHRQTTRETFPRGGSGMGFKSPRQSTVLFDYNYACGIDINKELLGLTKPSATGEAVGGYYEPGVIVRDNWLYNYGHKSMNVSGEWVSIINNHCERDYLVEGYDPYFIGGWEQTLDGHLETAYGGNGAISDSLSRGLDLGGRHLWVHNNWMNNTGADPANDGEAILCQAHGGSHCYGWALTRNTHVKGDGETGYFGGWGVKVLGFFCGWNELPGWVGAVGPGDWYAADLSFVENQSGGVKAPDNSNPVKGDPAGALVPPTQVEAVPQGQDAVRISWADAGETEVAYRVDRSIAGGPWTAVAYRPVQKDHHEANPPVWVDFTAPGGKALRYRVVSVNSKDNDEGASQPTPAITLP